jgi:biotin transport system substrate-specific component
MAFHFFNRFGNGTGTDADSVHRDATLTNDTTAPRFATLPARCAKVAAFTGLLVASTMVGIIPIPGNPVGITLQTFVLMLIALSLSPLEAASSVAGYLAIGAAGFPVFSGGMSTAALIGPSAGYLHAFAPAVLVTALLKRRIAALHAWSALVRDVAVCLLGCVALPLLSGIPVQALLTGTPIATVAAVSTPFIVNDCIKVVIACLIVRAAAGITRRTRSGNGNVTAF